MNLGIAVVMAFVCLASGAFGQEATLQTSQESGFLHWAWAFANSPLGVSVISGAILFILGRLFTTRPAWEQLYQRHKGKFFDAVRAAESAIPDDTRDRAAQRLDFALRYILQYEQALGRSASQENLIRAINQAHADGNSKLRTERVGEMSLTEDRRPIPPPKGPLPFLALLLACLLLLPACSARQLAKDLDPSVNQVAPRFYRYVDNDPDLVPAERDAIKAPMQAIEDRVAEAQQ